jgi:ABC-type lipoprotein release transport system permease subunit
VASAASAELVFVVDVSSFTKDGFTGTSTYGGKKVEIEFDDRGEGVFLTSDMARRLHVRKGSLVSVSLEEEGNKVNEFSVAAIGRSLRVSDSKVYYAVGREGGAIIRIRKV